MDDYELLYNSQDQAEDALGNLESLLTGFQLTLNPLKTQLVRLPESLDTDWRTALYLFEIRKTSTVLAQHDLSPSLAPHGRSTDIRPKVPC